MNGGLTIPTLEESIGNNFMKKPKIFPQQLKALGSQPNQSLGHSGAVILLCEVPRFPGFQAKVPEGSEVPSKGVKVVLSYLSVPSRGSGLRVLSKFQVKFPEGSEVPSKGSK